MPQMPNARSNSRRLGAIEERGQQQSQAFQAGAQPSRFGQLYQPNQGMRTAQQSARTDMGLRQGFNRGLAQRQAQARSNADRIYERGQDVISNELELAKMRGNKYDYDLKEKQNIRDNQQRTLGNFLTNAYRYTPESLGQLAPQAFGQYGINPGVIERDRRDEEQEWAQEWNQNQTDLTREFLRQGRHYDNEQLSRFAPTVTNNYGLDPSALVRADPKTSATSDPSAIATDYFAQYGVDPIKDERTGRVSTTKDLGLQGEYDHWSNIYQNPSSLEERQQAEIRLKALQQYGVGEGASGGAPSNYPDLLQAASLKPRSLWRPDPENAPKTEEEMQQRRAGVESLYSRFGQDAGWERPPWMGGESQQAAQPDSTVERYTPPRIGPAAQQQTQQPAVNPVVAENLRQLRQAALDPNIPPAQRQQYAAEAQKIERAQARQQFEQMAQEAQLTPEEMDAAWQLAMQGQ